MWASQVGDYRGAGGARGGPALPRLRACVPACARRVQCKMIAHGAMHAAFAGYTATAVGVVNTHMCLLPLELLAQAPRQARAGAEPAPLLQLCD